MKRLFAGAAVAAVAGGAGLAGSAVGQGTGGTVGEGAAGTLTVQIRATEQRSRRGVNPAVPRDKKRPKVADLSGANVDVLQGGKKVGTAQHFEVTTDEGAKKYKGGAQLMTNSVVNFGGGNLLFASCLAEDSNTDNTCAITGGAGRYAGARGTAVESFKDAVEDKKAKTFTFNVIFRFIA